MQNVEGKQAEYYRCDYDDKTQDLQTRSRDVFPNAA